MTKKQKNKRSKISQILLDKYNNFDKNKTNYCQFSELLIHYIEAVQPLKVGEMECNISCVIAQQTNWVVFE